MCSSIYQPATDSLAQLSRLPSPKAERPLSVIIGSAFERALMGAPRLTHQKIGVGALARRILLNPAVSYRRGVEASLRIRDEPMYTPHAALARTKRTPRIEEMSVFVISVQLVRSLI